MARPSIYTPELADSLCERVAYRPLNSVCKDDDMPSRETVYGWLHKKPEFLDKYTRARKIRAYARAESLDDVCDDMRAGLIDAAMARVEMDRIKWQAGKENSPVFGDRQVIAGDPEAPLVNATEEQLDARINALLKAALDTGQIE